MKLLFSVTSLLLLALLVNGHRTRSLLQGNGNGNGRGPFDNNGNHNGWGNGNKHGKIFDFRGNPGGARSFLGDLEASSPGKLGKVFGNSRWSRTADELVTQLDQDPDFGIDVENEALIYVCAGLAVPADAPIVAEAQVSMPREALNPGATAADPTPDQAFSLSSRPGAPNKIWLDFKGSTITNSAWNSNGNTITVPAYSTDSDPAFSTAELTNIVAIWRGVSEDYAPFNVDVTTINQVTAGTPATNYMRVAIGGTASSVLKMSGGGVAFVGVFGRSDLSYQPAFVFPGDLGNGYPKYVWEAVSHEAGHTMGLSHDGRTLADGSTEGYYQGANGWVPIMGAGYYQALSQWSKGEYALANNKEDDLAIISSKLTYITTGNGATLATATPLSPTVSSGVASASATGIVSKTGGSDFFSLNAARAGPLTISVSVAAPWGTVNRSNLDVLVAIYNASGNIIGRVGNASGLSVSSSINLPAAGKYTVAVRGVGSGDPTTGYSNYASLGQFNLVVGYPA